MKLRITVDGKTYEVEAEVIEQDQQHRGQLPPGSQPTLAARIAPETPVAAKSPAPADGTVDESKVFRSPISGVVVRVAVQVGQSVQENDELLVVEAMKMETVLTSPHAGKVAKVHAEAGGPVQVRQTLVEFE